MPKAKSTKIEKNNKKLISEKKKESISSDLSIEFLLKDKQKEDDNSKKEKQKTKKEESPAEQPLSTQDIQLLLEKKKAEVQQKTPVPEKLEEISEEAPLPSVEEEPIPAPSPQPTIVQTVAPERRRTYEERAAQERPSAEEERPEQVARAPERGVYTSRVMYGQSEPEEKRRSYTIVERSLMMANQLAERVPQPIVRQEDTFARSRLDQGKIESPHGDYYETIKFEEEKKPKRRYPWEAE
jgi:hypothetical protein